MGQEIKQSARNQQGALPLQYNRTIFKAIDSYLKNQDYLFKTKKQHFRYKSQPLNGQVDLRNTTQQQPVQESFQQTMRKAKVRAFHQRVASQMNESHHKQTNKHKLNELQYNKWYIKPEFRMKKPVQFSKDSKKRSFQTQFLQSSYQNDKYNRLTQTSQCDVFFKKQNHKLAFAEQFVQNDKNQISFLKQFKRKQAYKKCRSPQLVDLILKVNCRKHHQKSVENIRDSTKHSSYYRQSECFSKTTSKFLIEDTDVLRNSKVKKSGTLSRSKNRLTLLQTQLEEINQGINNKIKNNIDGGFRVQRVKFR